MVKQRLRRGFQVELENLFSWSGISALIGGLLLLAVWAAFEFIDDVAQYMHYAAPLITEQVLTVALVLGIINVVHFFIDIVAIGFARARKENTRYICLVSALTQLWIPPVGTFFGIMMLSLHRNWPGFEEGAHVDEEGGRGMRVSLSLAATYLVTNWLFLLLFINAIYILPMEFLNDAELIWLRFNIWNIIYAIVAFLGGLTCFFVIATVCTVRKTRGWRVMLGVECFFLLFSLPVGTYLAGVFYRNLLRTSEC